ncbi:MAG: inositol monophosphatase [Ardenticatenales bacterium]|nr:inositol monophosphatase [Ardenticatenales bacterium]
MNDPFLEQALVKAAEIAQEAGRLVMEYYHAEAAVHIKGGDARDLVTDADLSADAAIAHALGTAFPDHTILSEEAYQPGDTLDDEAPTWVVDPVDGTTNFAHRLPLFSISLGLRHRGEGQVGVVHAPALGWMFAAAAQQGGTLNDRPLRASNRTEISEAVVACDWARQPERRRLVLAAHSTLAEQAHTMRSMGSAALGLAAVAAGWIDIYFNYSLAPWDVAAGELLVREAGGIVTTLDGRPWRASSRHILASNGKLHEQALALLHPHLPEDIGD